MESIAKNKIKALSAAATLPSMIAALLPKIVCPLCWPLYAGLMSAVGISFVSYAKYLLPLTILFLIIALIGLGFRAKQRRGYKPFILGLLGSLFILMGKFYWDSDILLYAGLFLLISASIWNSWPKHIKTPGCSSCIK
ncbi:MAG TPA: MerC family mercury resistance protein [Candidatus Babeliales bacterium]|nr:MerC family mercury resistance protein [Candidatus Babeliales bacterium]